MRTRLFSENAVDSFQCAKGWRLFAGLDPRQRFLANPCSFGQLLLRQARRLAIGDDLAGDGCEDVSRGRPPAR